LNWAASAGASEEAMAGQLFGNKIGPGEDAAVPALQPLVFIRRKQDEALPAVTGYRHGLLEGDVLVFAEIPDQSGSAYRDHRNLQILQTLCNKRWIENVSTPLA
jgi:hypothetical protein